MATRGLGPERGPARRVRAPRPRRSCRRRRAEQQVSCSAGGQHTGSTGLRGLGACASDAVRRRPTSPPTEPSDDPAVAQRRLVRHPAHPRLRVPRDRIGQFDLTHPVGDTLDVDVERRVADKQRSIRMPTGHGSLPVIELGVRTARSPPGPRRYPHPQPGVTTAQHLPAATSPSPPDRDVVRCRRGGEIPASPRSRGYCDGTDPRRIDLRRRLRTRTSGRAREGGRTGQASRGDTVARASGKHGLERLEVRQGTADQGHRPG